MTTREKRREYAWKPAPYHSRDVIAMQALAAGEGSVEQQKRVLRWIMESAAGIGEVSYRSDEDGGDRETAFAEGKRFIGLQVKKLIAFPPAALAKLQKDEGQDG